MKNLFFIILIYSIPSISYGQESFKKTYKIPQTICLNSCSKILLKKTVKVKFADMSKQEQKKIKDTYPIGLKINYEIEKDLFGKKLIVSDTVTVNSKFYEKQIIKKDIPVKRNSNIIGFVKFEDNKLTVNPYLIKDRNNEYAKREIYHYTLENRQTITLRFTEWSVSTLTVPIKYRFKDDDRDIKEEFTTDFNANLFVGRTFYGKSSFFHRKKVGNITNTWKVTGGLLFGVSTVTLNKGNTSTSEEPLEPEVTKGLGSIGLGLTLSYNKINIGGFMGWDYSVGKYAERWNYNKKTWIGLAVGYSII